PARGRRRAAPGPSRAGPRPPSSSAAFVDRPTGSRVFEPSHPPRRVVIPVARHRMLPCSAVPPRPAPLLRPTEARADVALVPGCLSVIATCAVVGVAALLTFPQPPSHEPLGPRLFALAVGLFGGMGLQSVYSLLRGF